MNEAIKIPQQVGDLVDRMNELGALLTATEWARAAIVFAFTDVGAARGTGVTPPKLSIMKFTELGLRGLSSRRSVQRYRRSWGYAIEQGWTVEVEPGDVVDLPDAEFPSWGEILPEYTRPSKRTPVTQMQSSKGVTGGLDTVRKQIEKITTWARQMSPGRNELALELLDDVQDALDRLKDVLLKQEVSKDHLDEAQQRWKQF